MSRPDTYCPLPWQHLATHPHGGITTCCISDHTDGLNRARNFKGEYDEFLTLNNETIEQHMNSDYYKEVRLQMLNNEMPKACMRCYNEEDNGIKSKRDHERTVFPQNSSIWASGITREDGSIDMDLRFVELRLGNVCNVRCRTCNPASSSKWLDDYKDIVEKADFVNKGYLGLNYPEDFKWAEDDTFYDDLFHSAPNLEVLYINGGEPLLIDKHKDFLYKLVDMGVAKNVEIVYSTNVTIINKEYEDAWKEFRKVQMMLSLDDVGERNNYVRHLSKWEKVLETFNWLTTLENVNTNMMCTVSTLNVYYLKEYFEFYKNKTDYISLNFVNDPDYYDIRNLPSIVKWEILEKFNNPELKAWLMQDGTNSLEKFLKYTDSLDIIRNQSFEKTFPEWNEILRKYNV